jgi:lipopolysaccharide/colanic/teichoic acid biosynthesis glycosyltransferase
VSAAASNRVKVAHIATVDLSLRFLLLNQLTSLRDAGYSVTGLSSPGPHVETLREQGIHHISVPMTRAITPMADLVALWRLYRVIRRERFEIVHCHTPKAELLGQLAARLARVPVIVDTFRGTYEQATTSPIRRWLLSRMTRLAAACADVVLCQSRDATEAMATKVARPDRVIHLGNGIDVQHFDRRRLTPHALDAARKDLGLDPSQPVVGFVGRLVREKGILDLFHAMRLVRKQVPNAHLIIIGPTDDDKPDAIGTEDTTQYGASEHCTFTGLRTDMPALYALMDVFVLPSYREGFPRAPMEASAMGVPCVVTDIPGCREVVQHGRNGLLVPVADPSAIANAIVTLLTRKDLADQLGRGGREAALERFDEQRVFDTVKAAYRRVLANKSAAHQLVLREPASRAKRFVDVAVASLALLILLPIMALVALVVRCTMGSPILFRQPRPGLGGCPFVILKFRTMRQVADDKVAGPSSDHDRLGAIGRFLRAVSLDELPQLLNVLKGDMSLVGPRPLLMEYLGRYTAEQARRHEVKPGLTGWAQVNGRNALLWRERLAMDVWYVDHQSLFLDLQILARTVGMVVRRRGISAPGEATMAEFIGSER